MMNNNNRQRPRPSNTRNNKRQPIPKIRKKKKQVNYMPLIIFIGIVITLLIIVLQCGGEKEPVDDLNQNRVVNITAPETVITEERYNIPKLDIEIYSYASILYNTQTRRIIAAKNADEVTYPASLTKIMTAIVVIETIDPSEYFETYVTLDADIFEYITNANASIAGFKAGEKVRIIDLLYGVILPSGADACIGLARHISGSESGFVELMNAKATELGCENTYFVNSTGLHDINHRTTAADMLTILRYALQNDLFRTIFTTEVYTTGETNMRAEGITFRSTVFRAFTNNDYEIGYVVGGKTGYTVEAKLCLATLAKTPTTEYILITMGAGEGDNQTAYHVMDAVKIYNEYT